MGCCSAKAQGKVLRPEVGSPLQFQFPQANIGKNSQAPSQNTSKIQKNQNQHISSTDHIRLDSPKASGRGASQTDFSISKPRPRTTIYESVLVRGESNENLKDANSREFDSISNENLTKLPTKNKVNINQLDVSTTKSNKYQIPESQNDFSSRALKSVLNGYEAMFHDQKEENIEQYIYEMNDQQFKKYEQFTDESRVQEELPSGMGNKTASAMTEWAKVLQKHTASTEKSMMNTGGGNNKSKFEKLYSIVTQLKARNWYEELVGLYKEKQTAGKSMANMSSLTFDRKIMMLQEHFRWLVASVANTRLNFNRVVGAREFPPVRMQGKNPSGGNSDSNSDVLIPSKMNSNNPNNSQLRTNIVPAGYELDSSSGSIYARELPDAVSNVWTKGFIWKGVHFKLYSKKEASQLKREMRALKHLAIEYLQAETAFKFIEGLGSTTGMSIINANETVSQDLSRNVSQALQVILPLISIVESSSWVLLGTPIFSRKRAELEENLAKVLQNGSSGMFKSSYLLSGTNFKNYKLYYKNEDLIQSFSHQSHNISAATGGLSPSYLLLCNASRVLFHLPKVHVLFMMAQDESVNIMFTEFPKKGFLDYNQIKKMLGYNKLDVSLKNLKRRRSTIFGDPDNGTKTNDQTYEFEILKFKKKGWSFNMIYLNDKTKSLPVNVRATAFISKTSSNSTKKIRGNVLVFGQFNNYDSMIHPYFISDSYISSSAECAAEFNSGEAGGTRQLLKTDGNLKATLKGATQGNPPVTLVSASLRNSRSNVVLYDASRRESNQLNGSFCIPKLSKEDRHFVEYFSHSLCKSVDRLCIELNKTDKITSFNYLRDFFHRRGINMRFGWLVYARVNRKCIKEYIGIDILVRSLKKILNSVTSKKAKQFKSTTVAHNAEPSFKRDRMNEILLDKNEFTSESFFKKYLTHFVNLLVRGTSDNYTLEDNKTFFAMLTNTLFLSRLRTIDFGLRLLDNEEFDVLMSSDTLKDIINYAYNNANYFFDALQHHFNLSINYEVIRQIKNDKFTFILSPATNQLKYSDLSVIFQCDPYITLQERCHLTFLKLQTSLYSSTNDPTLLEYQLPPSLYKLSPHSRTENSEHLLSYDSVLRDYYEVPSLEKLNDWVVLLGSLLNSITALNSEQNFLMEVYILQIMLTFFIDGDEQGCSAILDKIHTFSSETPLCSPELTVMIQTWCGILTESKHFVECEQNYMMALLTLHKLYGDPRARGGRGTPWELFITSRLSILSRLQGKIHDAEYVEELYDATMMGLHDNALNRFYYTHPIYSEPFRDFLPEEDLQKLSRTLPRNISTSYKAASLFKTEGDYSHFERTQEKFVGSHPFAHWTQHLQYDENSLKIDVINQTLPRSGAVLKWMIEFMPLNLSSGIVWETSSLREFSLSIMQNAYTNSTSVSSISGYSVDRRDKSNNDRIADSMGGISTPKGNTIKYDKKQKKFSQGGNLVQIFEKDASTLCKREAVGVVYAWGQNNEGQVGTPTNFPDAEDENGGKKMRTYYPKTILSLKDTVIVSVSCGHTHSIAITISRRLLAWGDNKSGQLGLGKKAPAKIFIPAVVHGIEGVSQVTCGSEHTVALTLEDKVYSWGQGEGGLLGHGNTVSQWSPRKIEALDLYAVSSVICGGLHTLAITRQGHVYTWGRAEGGQLGVPIDQMIHDPSTNELYLTTPKRIRGALDGQFVTQVACGDAHSLALTNLNQVYGWGYTNSGQLGLGVNQDNFEPGVSRYNLQVLEPVLIERLRAAKIVKIYAGSTFSLFMNEHQELFGCGLNDFSQLGIEKAVTKIIHTDNFKGGTNAPRTTESAIPRKLDCFTSIPLLKVCCGENHSLALALVNKYYILWAWGMQKHAQLGLGDISANQSTPRPLSYLQEVMISSMGCGAYHSLVVLGEPTEVFKQEAFLQRSKSKVGSGWNMLYIEPREHIEDFFASALKNMEYTAPSDEGRIDNPKSIKKLY